MANTGDYSELLDCSCNMLRSAARKITQVYQDNLHAAGIKPTQFTILATIANTGPIQVTALAKAVTLERTGLTRNLKVLERNGWVESTVGEEDSRQRVVSLTAEGFACLERAIPFWKSAQAMVADQMGDENRQDLKLILQSVPGKT